jgi:hypothetical protein
MFRYTLEPAFDWSGEIQLAPDRDEATTRLDLLIAEVAAATGVPEREDE